MKSNLESPKLLVVRGSLFKICYLIICCFAWFLSQFLIIYGTFKLKESTLLPTLVRNASRLFLRNALYLLFSFKNSSRSLWNLSRELFFLTFASGLGGSLDCWRADLGEKLDLWIGLSRPTELPWCLVRSLSRISPFWYCSSISFSTLTCKSSISFFLKASSSSKFFFWALTKSVDLI